jgi:hypothetical protein
MPRVNPISTTSAFVRHEAQATRPHMRQLLGGSLNFLPHTQQASDATWFIGCQTLPHWNGQRHRSGGVSHCFVHTGHRGGQKAKSL